MILSNIVSYFTDIVTLAGTKLVDVVNTIGAAGVEVVKKVLLID